MARIAAHVLMAVGVAASVVVVGAQRRQPGQSADATVPVTIALKAGGSDYTSNGPGTCTYAPVASIYALRAEQWRVEQSDGSRSVALTVWHPSSGGDMMTLSLSTGGKRYAVNTVKVGSNGTPEGSGTITLARQGAGGTFTVSATAADSTRITGTIGCSAFKPAVAEGGD